MCARVCGEEPISFLENMFVLVWEFLKYLEGKTQFVLFQRTICANQFGFPANLLNWSMIAQKVASIIQLLFFYFVLWLSTIRWSPLLLVLPSMQTIQLKFS